MSGTATGTATGTVTGTVVGTATGTVVGTATGPVPAGVLGALTMPLIRAKIDEAVDKKYSPGIIGIHARPDWSGPSTFQHRGSPVQVVACRSALAVREAMLDWPGGGWLVIVTDRPPRDLGDGILAHLIGNRLRTPDEWEALRQRFSATGVAAELTADAGSLRVATGLLAAEPETGWPAAPGGVLTRDHAMSAVFRHRLGLPADTPTIDGAAILSWTAAPRSAGTVADLRALAGDAVTDAALDWAADRLGLAGQLVRPLLAAGQLADVVPLGIIAALLIDPALDPEEADVARAARIRLEALLGGLAPSAAALTALADETATLTPGQAATARADGPMTAVTARADALLTRLQADGLAVRSDVLPSGLRARLSIVADRLRAAAGVASGHAHRDVDAALVAGDAIRGIEGAWAEVQRHALADTDDQVRPFQAAVRLARWLAEPSAAASPEIADVAARHRDTDAWVDRAINGAAPGAGDPDHAAALAAVLEVVRVRRDAHDAAFAAALAAVTLQDPTDRPMRYIEDVLARDVVPLAMSGLPVLLLVLDGMSVATATEVIDDAAGRGWSEYAMPAARGRRATALAALPTLTEVSRTSLFCGRLTSGGQDQERAGIDEIARAHGFRTRLFHKKPLDSSQPGYAVSKDVGAALDDTDGLRLVACVLNTIDDALDRSDPGGTDWTVDAIKHLRPLLERARAAGRAVILTADHGHIVERRQGAQRSFPDVTSNRSRAAEPPAGDGEVLVEGHRVVGSGGSPGRSGGRAVLAVDERLRYGPLKAGYHGGASPAEVIVPVCYLVSGTAAPAVGDHLVQLGNQAPAWWDGPVVAAASTEGAAGAVGSAAGLKQNIESQRRPPQDSVRGRRAPDTAQRALPGFDLADAEPPLGAFASAAPLGALAAAPQRALDATWSSAGAATPATVLADAVLDSSVYAAQAKLAGRTLLPPEQVRSALIALLADPGHRLPLTALVGGAASGLRARGAFALLQRLLNVEGYPVVALDADGLTAVLDEDLLREQFGVGR